MIQSLGKGNLRGHVSQAKRHTWSINALRLSISLTPVSLMILEARAAYRSVLTLSSLFVSAGEIVAIMVVLAFPPNEVDNSMVNLLSR